MTKLPTQQQCLQYFEEYKVPSNIKKHCLKVQEVSVFLAKKLQEAGIKINLELVRAGAILHDLFKMAAIEKIGDNPHQIYSFSKEQLAMRDELRKRFPNKYETEIAYEIFKEEFPELAVLLLREGQHDIEDKKIEEALINYVDYRTFKEEIVSLEERFAYFAEVYNPPNDYLQKALELSRETERTVFERLDIKPEELGAAVENE
ncbi:MAG TPA: HD domain-containing protein [Candidatus Nanoarchaeia archaeon]|nr:HD domain-containing protein [Candidatus Nanoarchaeia archaeon]